MSNGLAEANIVYGSSGGGLAFNSWNGTSQTERMRIDASGNVGIGTSSPLSKLDVAGGITARANGAEGGELQLNNIGDASAGLVVDVSSADVGRIFQTRNNATLQIGQLAGTGGGGVTLFTSGSLRLTIDSSGSLVLAGSTAQKATGTTWSNPSDQRLKSNIIDYPKGINELMQVRVREWEYNGKGGTTAGMAGLGVIADEVMTVLPNTVDTYDAKMDEADEETTAIKKFDATEITWLLVKAVQEQQQMIQALQADIAALKGV
jgi:hypothetical protein